MQIQTAEFIKSAASPSQFLARPIPHIVFTGKSNVGKSSLLNRLLNRKNLAKTSQTPGKTRLVNYFLINDRFFFTDLPGYGYAKVSKEEQKHWGQLIETYLKTTPTIAMIFLLIDIRHDPGAHDRQMIEWLHYCRLPFRILLTKADKLSNNKVFNQRTHIAQDLALAKSELITTSAIDNTGIKDIWTCINQAYQSSKNPLTEDAP